MQAKSLAGITMAGFAFVSSWCFPDHSWKPDGWLVITASKDI
jgi:hypothetical protein